MFHIVTYNMTRVLSFIKKSDEYVIQINLYPYKKQENNSFLPWIVSSFEYLLHLEFSLKSYSRKYGTLF